MYIWVYFLSFHLSGFFYWLKIWFRFFFCFSFLSFFFSWTVVNGIFRLACLLQLPAGGEVGENRVEQLDLSLPGISPVPIASPFLADKIIIIIF